LRAAARSNDLNSIDIEPGLRARERLVLSGGDAGVFLRAVPARQVSHAFLSQSLGL